MMKTIRRPRSRGGALVGKMGHASAKYSKNPRVQNSRRLEGFRENRRAVPISDPKPSMRDLLS